MENTKTIITPSGYTVVLKNEITYGEYEDMQALMGQNIKLDPNTGKPTEIDFNSLRDANDKTMALLVLEISKNGEKFNGSVRDLPVKDGKVIKSEVDLILTDAAPDEVKKGI